MEVKVDDGGSPQRPRRLMVSQPRLAVILRWGIPITSLFPKTKPCSLDILVPHNGDLRDSDFHLTDMLYLGLSEVAPLFSPPSDGEKNFGFCL